MKKMYFFLLMAMSLLPNISILAQNWLTSGNTGLTSSNYLGAKDAHDVIFKTNASERGRIFSAGGWRFGTSTNYAKIDTAGALTFTGTGTYRVGGNKYVFRYTTQPNIGLYYNSTKSQYEFRNSSAIPRFTVSSTSGNGAFTGTLKIGAYTLPATDGTNGQVLKTNGAGTVSWSTVTSSSPGYWAANGTTIHNTNTGNVGLGTSSPGAPLHILNANASELLRLQSASPYISFYDNSNVYQGFLWKNATNDMVLGTSCNNAAGKVIIQLNCADHYTFDQNGMQINSGASPGINFSQNNVTAGSIFTNVNDLNIDAKVVNPLISPATATPGNLLLQVNRTGALNLKLFTGNVGIGTATPTTKLQVGTGDASWGITHSSSTVKVGTYIGSSGGWLATSTNSNLYFATNLLNGNNYAQLTLLTNGNFGVGTINPQFKLDVCGTIRAKEVLVETGWCDYVFDKDYILKPLDEVKDFIEENKHLPDVPSATDVAANGVRVAEMDSIMIKKIEELTLYVIQQNKQIKDQNKQIQELEQKIVSMQKQSGASTLYIKENQ
ncbi:hypothetical protein QTN47_15185 [Danxiaibacter flavus]|uniref:Peptidase S74 domain-containing protein n=1 Tax=Danxiaibacter flavus TaxID=3049108 RepID=A0ABV3ZH19_9BACT|nr:hypothetical protein QNM32_15195 [Chitinophagaceae bacterium DXS]